MEKGDPKEVELEEELDVLYRKVSSRDQSEDVFYAPEQLKTEAMVTEEPRLHTDDGEMAPAEERRAQISIFPHRLRIAACSYSRPDYYFLLARVLPL